MGKGNKAEVNKVFNISLVIHLSMAFLLLLFTESIGVFYVKNYLNIETAKVSDALFVLRFSTYATIFSIVSAPFQGLVTAQERFSTQALIEITRSILAFSIALILVYYGGNRLRLYSVLVAGVSIVPFLLFYYYCKHNYREIIQWKFQSDKAKYKEMGVYSGWIMIGAAASVGQTTGSALIINSFFGTVLNATFGIANQVNGIVSMFAKNMSQAAIPQITKSFSSGNRDRTINLASYISKYTWFLMYLPALPILLETDFLLNLWLGDVPPYTVIFCQLLIISTLIGGLGNGLGAIVQATGKIKYFQIILSTTSLLNLPIAYVLYSVGCTPFTIVLVNIITTSINVVVSQILLKIIIDFDVRSFLEISYLRVFYVAVLTTPLFFMQNFFPVGLTRFLLFTIFSVFWLLSAIYFAGLEKREREMLNQIVKIMVKKVISNRV